MHVNCIIYIFVFSRFICKSLMQRVVSRCPENKASWREREAAWQCSQNHGYFYHCIGTLDDTLVETCLIPRSMSLNGQCPFIDLAGSKFHIEVCPFDTRSECPHGDSTSNNLYKYPFCTNYWQFIGSSTTTIKGERFEPTTKFKQHSSQHSIDNTYITLDVSPYSYSTRYSRMITIHKNEDQDGGYIKIFTWPLLGAAAVILLLVIVVVKLVCRLKQKSHRTHVVQGNKQDETPSSSNLVYGIPIYHVYNEINEQATEHGSSSSDSYLEPKSKETPNPYLIIKHSSYETLPKTTIESIVNIHVCKDGKGKKKSCSI